MYKNDTKVDSNCEFIENITANGSKPIHFIGLGGIGMSGLAKFLLELGYKVSGSDIKDGPNLHSLTELGGTVYIGHTEKNIGDAAVIVASTAIKEDNPELVEARNKDIPVLHRSQLLEALMSGLGRENLSKQISIGVSGTHGKTTTSGMVSSIYENAGLNPSIVVGGKLPILKTNSKFGLGNYFISELDESDGTIAIYKADVTVITNLEADHLDHYSGGLEQLLETFEGYIKRLPEGSKLVINADCSGNRELLKRVNHPGIILYSCNPENELYANADYRVEDVKMCGFDSVAKVYKKDEFIGELKLRVPGIHNISNALVSLAVALENGVEFESAVASLYKFTGMKRRFQVLGSINDVLIVDDYAHHPTEVQVTLKGARSIVEAGTANRVVVAFQPHRYTRLKGLWNDFVNSFSDADKVYVCEVYAAGESPIEGYCAESFAKAVKHDNAVYAGGCLENVAKNIAAELQPGDIILTMGAGTITNLGSLLIEKL